jgi:rhodanese-related sulfurtransferase
MQTMNFTPRKVTATIALTALFSSFAGADELAVGITPTLKSVSLGQGENAVVIQRNQDRTNTIAPTFQRTSRQCPPFCIQPMQMPEGVETIGEIEMLDYLQRSASGDDSVLVIDSRGPKWLQRGTIPGSVNIHYKRLSLKASDEEAIATILEDQFDAERMDMLWNFRHAKTLVLYCNGPWCGQSPTNIKALLRMGYPASKIKWYRGGMQAWEILGLTTTTPGE